MNDVVPLSVLDVREALLEAADALLAVSTAVSVEAVAQRAGACPVEATGWFPTDRALLTACAGRAHARLAETVLLTRAERAPRDGPSALEAWALAYARFGLSHPVASELMFRFDLIDGDDPALQRAREATCGLLEAELDACVDERWLPRRKASDMAVAVWSTIHGLVTLWRHGCIAHVAPDEDPDALVARVCRDVIDAMLRGVRVGETPVT